MKRVLYVLAIVPMLLSCSGEEPSIDPNQILGFDFAEPLSLPSGVELKSYLYTSFNVKYVDRTESFLWNSFSKNEQPKVEFNLHKEDETENLIDKPLASKQKYVLDATFEGFTATTTFTADEKFTLLKHEDLEMTNRDLSSSYAPATGDVKMLVIPVALDGDWLDVWESDYIETMSDLYFGDEDPLSLRNYYKDASFDAMNISGLVSDVYSYTDHTSNEIQGNGGYEYLTDMMNKALAWVKDNHPEINWREFDLNKNKAIDNIHFVTNFNPGAYQSQTGKSVWATTLWPHMSEVDNTDGTLDSPTFRVYSCGVLDHLISPEGNSAITPIHEQGHIFGLPDYYDYGGKVDYIGSLDMQSGNVLDWNSYSKLTTGWVDSYVVKDECTVTITPASKQGKCIIIPADYDTFNNSAFDEYFLIELFANYGNNKKFPSYSNYIGTGIRLYHVDARLVDYNGKETDNPRYGFQIIDNNNYDYSFAYYGGDSRFKKYCDKKLLTLIQKEGNDTFGNTNDRARHYLNHEDLFVAGDTFTFKKYNSFLSKQGKERLTMDNGEEFPYKIEFVEVNNEYATMKITKIPTSTETK